MFYRVNENNNIIDSAEFKYSNDCLETDKNIIRDINGNLVFEDEFNKVEIKNETQTKLIELQNWFNDYTKYEQMLTRRAYLGIDDEIVDEFRNKTYKSLKDLYQEAEVVAGEIKLLKEV